MQEGLKGGDKSVSLKVSSLLLLFDFLCVFLTVKKMTTATTTTLLLFFSF